MTREQVIERLRRLSGEELGVRAERIWTNIFKAAGLSYIELCKASQHGAPMQRGPEDIILPDFEVSSPQFTFYVDSKGKRHPIMYRNAHEIRHGIDEHNFKHYQYIAEHKRQHCCLAIFECFSDEANREYSGALLIQTLNGLSSPYYGIGEMSYMVFWPRTRFFELARLSTEELVALWNGPKESPSLRQRLWDFLDVNKDKPCQRVLF